MKILLLGAQGQLGRELCHWLKEAGEVRACGRGDLDLTENAQIEEVVNSFEPDVIVNSAAYTAVDKAESDHELAFEVNTNAVRNIAYEAAKRDILLVHYSTDYVFDGTKTQAYHETDVTCPINIYGESKLEGEKAIIASGCRHLIFRTTWVIGKYGHNFAKTILRLASERDSLGIIGDQHGVLTSPTLISRVTLDAIKNEVHSSRWTSGIYNLIPHGKTTWFGIAKKLVEIAEDAGLTLSVDSKTINAITTDKYPTPAKRPANSLLNNNKLQQQLSFDLP
ncbi:MAG: dTDP-4-dehydrorhamnose reductase, partial [Lentilitoribacter sp.]